MKGVVCCFTILLFFTFETYAQLTPAELQRRIIEKMNSRNRPQLNPRGGAPEQDCNNAIAVCQNTFFQPSAYSGFGTIQEVPSTSCLAQQEKNSVWYIFTVQTSGTLEFIIDPNTNSDDYDFALYDLTGRNCSDIIAGNAPEVRCNFSATSGNTGLSNAGFNASEPAGGNVWSSILNVTTGQTYVLTVSNYTSSQSGYTLTFGGTADIFDVNPPSASLATTPCGSNFLTLQMSEAVLCDSISPDGSEFTLTGPGGPFTITGAAGINCGNATSQITIDFSPPLQQGSNYVLTVNNGSDGNTLVDNCGNAMVPGTAFNFNATPPPATIIGPTDVCKGSLITLTASFGTAYQWSPSGDTTQTISVNPTANTTYSVTVENGSCIQTATHSITTLDAPVANFTYSPATICVGQQVTFTSNSTLVQTCIIPNILCFDNPSFLIWDFGDGSSSLGLDFGIIPPMDPTHTYNTPGTYNVSLTVQDTLVGGCSNTLSVPINVLGSGGTLTVSNDTSICSGQSVALSVTGGSFYSWTSNPAGFTSTDSVINVTPIVTTTYNVSSPGCGSTLTGSVTVTVTPGITVSIPLDSVGICLGMAANITATGASTYSWTPATGLNTTSGATVTANPSVTTTYYVTGTNASGCQGTDSIVVYPYATINPVITPLGPTSFCPGGSVDLDAGTGPTYDTYLWSTGDTSRIITVSTTGTYIVTITDVGSCQGIDSITVQVSSNLNPVITPNGPTGFCFGGNVSLNAGNGYATYLWSNGDTTPVITVDQAGSYTVEVSNGLGCSGVSPPVNVIVNPNPNPSIVANGPTMFCSGDSIDLDAGAGYSSYLWNNGDTTQIITVSQGGNYSVMVTDNMGCTGTSLSKAITILANPNPVITANGPTSFCPGDSVELDVGAGYNSYLWNTGATTQMITTSQAGDYTVTVTDANACTGISQTINVSIVSNLNPTITANGPTTICEKDSVRLDAGPGYNSYQWSTGDMNRTIIATQSGDYSVSVSNGGGCSGADTISVVVLPMVVAEAGPDVSICLGEETTLEASGGSTYSWTPSTDLDNPDIADPTASPETTIKYYVTVRDNICSGIDNVTVTVNPIPEVDIIADTTITLGQSLTLFATGGSQYSWSPADGLNDPNIANPTASPLETTEYTVTVTDDNNCKIQQKVKIKVLVDKAFYIPTAISPNGDGFNDYLRIIGGTGISKLDFKVYDRWGEQIFRTNDKSIGWDGTFKGEMMDMGVYVYVVQVEFDDGSTLTKKGNVTLLK